MTELQEIEAKALQLSVSDRGHLIHDLIMSFEQSAVKSDAYEKEIQRRISCIKNGTAAFTSAEDVFADIENRFA